MHGQNSKVRFPFRVNGCTVIEQYTGSDWKFGDDYFSTNDLFVPVYPKNKPADFDHSEIFGSRDTPWYIKVSLNVFPESKEIRDALYTLSTSFFEGNDWCMVVCSPSFLEDSARKISLDPVLNQYPGVKPLVLEWLDLTAIYDLHRMFFSMQTFGLLLITHMAITVVLAVLEITFLTTLTSVT